MTKNVYNEKQVKDEGAVRMSDVYATINYVLVNLINEIWEVEGKAIITDEFKDITIFQRDENIGVTVDFCGLEFDAVSERAIICLPLQRS